MRFLKSGDTVGKAIHTEGPGIAVGTQGPALGYLAYEVAVFIAADQTIVHRAAPEGGYVDRVPGLVV